MKKIKIESDDYLGVDGREVIRIGETSYRIAEISHNIREADYHVSIVATEDAEYRDPQSRDRLIDTYKSMIEQRDAEIAGLRASNGNLGNECRGKDDRLATLEKENRDLRSVINHGDAQCQKCQRKHHDALASTRSAAALARDIAEKDREIQRLRAMVPPDGLSHAATCLANAKAEASEKEIARLRDYISGMEKRCFACHKRHESEVTTEEETKALRREIEALGKSLRAERENGSVARKQLSYQRQKSHDLRKTIRQMRESSSDHVEIEVSFNDGRWIPFSLSRGDVLRPKMSHAMGESVMFGIRLAPRAGPADHTNCRCWVHSMDMPDMTALSLREFMAEFPPPARVAPHDDLADAMRYSYMACGTRDNKAREQTDIVISAMQKMVEDYLASAPTLSGRGAHILVIDDAISDGSIPVRTCPEPGDGDLLDYDPEDRRPRAEFLVLCPKAGVIEETRCGALTECRKCGRAQTKKSEEVDNGSV